MSKNDNEIFEISESAEKSILDSIKKTYYLVETYWDIIDKNLPKNLNKFCMFVAKYRNKYINILETPYPIDYPKWTTANEDIVYECTGIDEEQFTQDCIKYIIGPVNSKYPTGYRDPYIKDKGYLVLLNMMTRWLMINRPDSRELSIVQQYVGYAYYWTVFYRRFKVYKPKESIMRYTIDNMSYKNSLKAIGSVDKWIFVGTEESYKSYKDRLLDGSDYFLLYIGEKIRGKFDGYMKNIFVQQKANEKAGNHVFISKDEVDDIKAATEYGVSEVISLADKFTTKFFANPIDEKTLDSVISYSKITVRDLRNTIVAISDNNSNLDDVRKFYQSLFFIFLDDTKYTPKDIGSIKFYGEMMKLYKPGNTHDKNRIIVRDTIDKWLKIGSATYRASNRADTISKFRRSIYDYFILKVIKDK